MKKPSPDDSRRRHRTRTIVLEVVVAMLVAVFVSCDDSPCSPCLVAVPVGVWGGEHIQLTLSETGGTASLDCASGQLDQPLVADAESNFDARGTFVREGGPEPNPEEPMAVRYHGYVFDRQMALTISRIDSNEEIGQFSLRFNREGRVFFCR